MQKAYLRPVKRTLLRAGASGEHLYIGKMHANGMHCISKEAYFASAEYETVWNER